MLISDIFFKKNNAPADFVDIGSACGILPFFSMQNETVEPAAAHTEQNTASLRSISPSRLKRDLLLPPLPHLTHNQQAPPPPAIPAIIPKPSNEERFESMLKTLERGDVSEPFLGALFAAVPQYSRRAPGVAVLDRIFLNLLQKVSFGYLVRI